MAEILADKVRCDWANCSPSMARYHDEEWGVPLHDDVRLFEFLLLETMQAGLSWATVLARRAQFQSAFADFDVVALSQMGEQDVDRWMQDASLIRNRAKLRAVIGNARAFRLVQQEFGSFDRYQWAFVDAPIIGGWKQIDEVPAVTDLAVQLSKDLKKRGFTFIGPTICYAHMQATGLVDDHLVTCWKSQTTAANG